jgi:hypothetical protein
MYYSSSLETPLATRRIGQRKVFRLRHSPSLNMTGEYRTGAQRDRIVGRSASEMYVLAISGAYFGIQLSASLWLVLLFLMHFLPTNVLVHWGD